MKRIFTIRFFSFAYPLLISLAGFLHSAEARGQQFHFEEYNVDKGLSQSEVNTLFEDSRGYLWIGTRGGGMDRFNGKTFVNFNEEQGLGGNIVTSIVEDKEGNIWAGTTWGGITKYDGKNLKTYSFREGETNLKVSDLLCSADNKIWAATNKGLAFVHNNEIHLSRTSEIDMPVNLLCMTKPGELWLATDSNIYRYFTLSDSLTKFKVKDLPENKIHGLYCEDSTLWVGINGRGIHKASVSTTPSLDFMHPDFKGIPDNITFNDFYITENHTFWITTPDNGVFKVKGERVYHYNSQNGYPNVSTSKVIRDRSGTLWFGTNGRGLVKLGSQQFQYFPKTEGLNKKDVFSLEEDQKGRIWVGTSKTGVYLYDGANTINHFHAGNSILKSNSIRDIHCDDDNRVWLATNKGLFKYEHGRMVLASPPSPHRYSDFRSVFSDSQGNIWAGTYGKGLFQKKPDGKWKRYTSGTHQICHDYIYKIHEDQKGNLWMGTGNGVIRYNGFSFTCFGVGSGLCNSYVGDIAEDNKGNLWFGTDRCISKYDGVNFKNFDKKDGLKSATVYLLQKDDKGNLWVGTNRGLDKITFNEYGIIDHIHNYGIPEGFMGLETNSRASFKDSEGNLWFGTVKGVYKLNTKAPAIRKTSPLIHITGIKLFLESTDWTKYTDSVNTWFNIPFQMKLPYNKNYLSFYFEGVKKNNPEKIRYKFKLEGFDQNWSPLSYEKSATYSNLAPGQYTFKVIAGDENGWWTEEPASLSFTISPPFWKTWWFIVLSFIALVFLIYRIYIWRERKEEKNKRKLEMMVGERTRELLKEKEEKETLLKEIHHRVKNNLQVINSLINLQSGYINDPKSHALFEECTNRIKSMALIHEKLYESQTFSEISLETYIKLMVEDLIEAYSLNKETLDVNIDLDVKIFGIDTLIPLGLLLNEIISNTLKYAFEDLNESKKGRITIQLRKAEKDNEYILIAGDNGKGVPRKTWEHPDTLGLELIKILSDQLQGSVELLEGEGTNYKIIFRKQ